MSRNQIDKFHVISLTISPFRNLGGSHETIILALEEGIALMFWGADGTA